VRLVTTHGTARHDRWTRRDTLFLYMFVYSKVDDRDGEIYKIYRYFCQTSVSVLERVGDICCFGTYPD
jgi:hypothetical protein